MKSEQWKAPFDRAGMWILERFPGILCGKQGKKTAEKLKLLETTRERISLEDYYKRKFSRMLMFLFGGGMVLGLLALGFPGKVEWMEHPQVERPDYGAGSRETALTAKLRDQEALDILLTIEERKYSDAEIHEIFEEISGSLETEILGENKSLEEVKTDLMLPSSFRDGVVAAVWSVEPPDYMDDAGHFFCEIPENGVLAALKVTLSYGKEEMMQELPVRFVPKDKSSREQAVDELRAAAEAAGEKNPGEAVVELPSQVNGESVQWGKRAESPLAVGMILLVISLWYLYGKDDRELDQEEERRKRQMIMDYPVILYKMSMLLGAGMTIRGAFFKVAFHYRDQDRREVRYAYEEMLLTCYEMEQGVGEAAAYENFGQRCRDLRYLKFGSLLSQNLKKGSKGLVDLLEQEARAGMEERKNLARKLGEEAGTRLLIPMMIMMILVIAILLLPAMLSF